MSKKILSISPHDQSIVGELEITTPTEISEIVFLAKTEFEKWKQICIKDRCVYIDRFIKLLQKNRHELAMQITIEMGKPIEQSYGEIDSEIEFIKYYINNGHKHLADEIIFQKGNKIYHSTYEPYGVCVCVCPWNFPLSMVTSGVVPALIAGNTVIVKPSEYTCQSQKLIVNLLKQTGLPAGVVNLVIGNDLTGKQLLDSDIDLVWFTGSTKAGLEIFKKCGEKFIKSILEMGGSSAGIVMADADINNAVENLYWARFLNCGQVCTAIKRLFVEESIYDEFLAAFLVRVNKATIGNPKNKVDIGPLVNIKQFNLISDQVTDAIDKGAIVETGGKKSTKTELSKGNYYEPTILTNVNEKMRILNEESFGPVIPIMSFKTESEAIYLANKSDYGLSAEIYTSDYTKGERIANKIQSGTVAINTDNFFRPECPFGGYKKSGMGREYGKIGMQEFAQIKVISINKI